MDCSAVQPSLNPLQTRRTAVQFKQQPLHVDISSEAMFFLIWSFFRGMVPLIRMQKSNGVFSYDVNSTSSFLRLFLLPIISNHIRNKFILPLQVF